jgi:hypothetical protein
VEQQPHATLAFPSRTRMAPRSLRVVRDLDRPSHAAQALCEERSLWLAHVQTARLQVTELAYEQFLRSMLPEVALRPLLQAAQGEPDAVMGREYSDVTILFVEIRMPRTMSPKQTIMCVCLCAWG